ncbi:MAG TPA: isochorismatase family cysteine hydrolase [Solirubrobacteraceae bacterium]|nr:isochorismatase family cysteine hydrolase [Solirubrobacteraceae bacterium]
MHMTESSAAPPEGTAVPIDPHTTPDFATAALITIDVQRDTLDGGPLEIPGTSAAASAMRTLLDAFRSSGRPIVHVVRLYRPDGSNVDPCRRGAVEGGLRVLAPGQDGSQPAVGLLPDAWLTLDAELLLAGSIQQLAPREVVIYKPRWGAFYDTPLYAHLREQDVTTLVFCGCNFPNCPRTSIYEASERDYRIVLATDATSGVYERGEQELAAIGVQLMTAGEATDAVAATGGGPSSASPQREGTAQ